MSLRPDTGSSSPSEMRRRRYKIGIDADESRRRREEDLVAIRKNKRQEILLNKRTQNKPREMALKQVIPAMIQRLRSEYPAAQLQDITHYFKHMLILCEKQPPFDKMLTEGFLPRFVELLSRNDKPELQLEALLVLVTFATGSSEHTRVIVELGVLPAMVNLLRYSTKNDIKEEIVCGLGIIASDSPSNRDLVLNHDALLPLLSQLNQFQSLYMLKVVSFCLAGLVHGKPPVNFEQVKPALPVLQRLMYQNDEEVVSNACWALCHLSEGPIDTIQAITEIGLLPKILDLLEHPPNKVTLPALQTIGNVVTGDDAQTQLVTDSRLLPCLRQLLTSEYNKSIFNEVCWTISCITAGNRARIQAVIDANIIPLLVQFLQHAEFDIKKEAAWAIFNVTSGGSHDHIRYLADQGCIKALCQMLTFPDPKVVSICLQGLENILVVGEADKQMRLHDRVNVFAQMVDECGGWDEIDNLQFHENNEISEIAVRISEVHKNDNPDLSDFNFGS